MTPFVNSVSHCLNVICFLLALTTSNTVVADVCVAARTQFEHRFDTLQKRSLNQFGEQISNPENFPVWINGAGKNKNQVIYLLHGFIGTPFEMHSTAKSFMESGYTVVLDILPGHGLSAQAANEFTKTDLQRHVFANLDAITKCASKVHLIGFSTGSTLLHQYLQKKSPATIASISLISPYYRPTLSFGDLLSQGTALLISTLSVDFAYTVSHFPDIKVAYLDPDHYHREIPLVMANEINALGEETYTTSAQIRVPILLLTSSNDKIASAQASYIKIKQDFSSIQTMHFNPVYFAPHHLMAESVSPVAGITHQFIADFIHQHKLVRPVQILFKNTAFKK